MAETTEERPTEPVESTTVEPAAVPDAPAEAVPYSMPPKKACLSRGWYPSGNGVAVGPNRSHALCAEDDPRGESHGHIAAYMSKHSLLPFFEDLVAALVEQQPKKPWMYLAKTLEKHLPKLKAGASLRKLMADTDVDDDRSANPMEKPRVYTKWLDSHGVHLGFQETLRDIVQRKMDDPHTAVLEAIKKRATI